MTLLCFLDTETTGLDPLVHAPWEVSWTIASHIPDDMTLTVLSSHTTFITLTPQEIADADPVALQIGRYAERYLPGLGVAPREALARLRNDLRRAGAETPRDVILVGACPGFDEAMLARWWGSVNDRPWHYHLLDVETLMAGNIALEAVGAPPWKYSDLLDAFEIVDDPDLKHTAAGDVLVTLRAYAKVYAAVIQ